MKHLNHSGPEAAVESGNDHVLLKWDGPSLKLDAIGEDRLHRILEGGAEVRWQRYATVRRVPQPVLRNAYRNFRNGIKRVDMDRLGATMKAAHTIKWEQTESLSQNEYPTEATSEWKARSRAVEPREFP